MAQEDSRVSPETALSGPDNPGPRDRFIKRLGDSSFSASIASNYIGRGWEAAMSVAFVPLYIRYLGPEAYGIVGLIAVIQSFMLILDLGMTPTLTREAARFQAGEHKATYLKDLLRSVETVVLLAGIVIVAVIAVAAPLIAGQWVRADALSTSVISDALMIGGALIAMRFFESVFRGTLYGLERQLLCNVIGASFATVRGGGAVIALALFDAELRGFFAWQVIASVFAVIAMRAGVYFVLPKTSRHGRFSIPALRSIGRFAGGMVVISILSLAATQADKVVLSRIIPLRDFGYYIFAVNVAIIIGLVSAPIMTALYPRIIAFVSAKDEAGLALFFHRWARIVCVLTAPIAALMVGFAPMLILAWSGNPELAHTAGPLLSVIAIGTFLHGQCVLPYYIQLSHGWTGLSIWTNLIALVVTVGSLILFVPRYGAIAGAWTWVAVASIYFFGALPVMFTRYLKREGLRFFLLDIAAPSGAAFIAIFLAAHVAVSIPDTWFGHYIILALALGMASGASIGAALILERLRPTAHS